MNVHNIIFVILAVIIILSSIATVVTRSIIRAATYLLFVLLGTAGIYFLMGYTFLGAVQTLIYAGGIIVLYVFAILLTKGKEGEIKTPVKDASPGLILTLLGFLVFVGVLFKQKLFENVVALGAPEEPAGALEKNSIDSIGSLLLSTEHGGYLLPFEAVSVLLLACIVAGLLIARKY